MLIQLVCIMLLYARTIELHALKDNTFRKDEQK